MSEAAPEQAPDAPFHHAPAGAHLEQLRVRSYEVGRSGAVGLGTLLRYCEALATEASAARGFDFDWYERHQVAWVVRTMVLRLGQLPRIGDDLRLATWIAEFKRVQAQREYALWLPAGGRLVARASARWAYVDRTRGVPVRLHDELLRDFQVLGHSMPPHALATEPTDANAVSRDLLLSARECEIDSQQHINNCVYADWLSEGLSRTLLAHPEVVGARHPCPRTYQIEYVKPAQAGDEVRVTTQVAPSGSRRLSVRQEIAHALDGAVYVRARSEHLLLPAVSPSPISEALG